MSGEYGQVTKKENLYYGVKPKYLFYNAPIKYDGCGDHDGKTRRHRVQLNKDRKGQTRREAR